MKKVVIAGGTGFLGTCLAKFFARKNIRVVILSRRHHSDRDHISYYKWDGKNPGQWTEALENADVLINLNGKSVDCRYTPRNKELIYDTRLDSTYVLGQALHWCQRPPKLWINAASATIYRHSLDKPMDEMTGEPGAGFSVDVCKKWESAFNSFKLEKTRKALIRTGIVLSAFGGAYQKLKMLAKTGLGGKQGPGNQYFSWIHENDFVRIIEFIMDNERISGVLNAVAPYPVTNSELMATLRRSVGIPFCLPIPGWLLKTGAFAMRTEPELILKSRYVIPAKLLDAGYQFEFAKIGPALNDLCKRAPEKKNYKLTYDWAPGNQPG